MRDERNHETTRAKMAELQSSLDRYAPGLFSRNEKYVRLHTLASSLAASLAFRYGELAHIEATLRALLTDLRVVYPNGSHDTMYGTIGRAIQRLESLGVSTPSDGTTGGQPRA